jgi:cell division septal protein FtsQ
MMNCWGISLLTSASANKENKEIQSKNNKKKAKMLIINVLAFFIQLFFGIFGCCFAQICTLFVPRFSGYKLCDKKG